ncbi:MAG TPA: 2Fe-2S iron-sulfur cluster-binding protein [Phycisphaerae bacterium]|nr:2Fe-2S iron-sulfur cluster-binding protein [Phycisphaerae bacterium]
MPRLTIDNQEVEVPDGATVLDAARGLGIEIPTLCHCDGCEPSTSCMVCLVKVKDPDRFVASCGARAEEGMVVESETDEVRDARRPALELLLSDHPADCIAPCQTVCPAGMNIPRMIRQIAAGDVAGAAETARSALVLPATLGRICPAPCEKGCRRAQHDAGLAIRLLHRHAADTDLASETPWTPPRRAPTGKRVAIVGAGPAGLAAAWHLLQEGHGATLFDDRDAPGGMLRYGIGEDVLPRSVLDAEIALIERLGAEFRMGVTVGRDVAIEDLARDFGAVLIASGRLAEGGADGLGLETSDKGLKADRQTFATPRAGVFAAGDAVQPRRMAVRAVADGKAAAGSIIQYLAGHPVAAPERPFTTRLGRPTEDEMAAMLDAASHDRRVDPAGGEAGGFTADEARSEAPRCLHCDCRKADTCLLRKWSIALGVKPTRHSGTRRPFELHDAHPDVVYEPGKCISCGLCIQVASRRGEALGLAFWGRGFGVRIGVPFHETLAAGLKVAAAECVAACPTGALAYRNEA